MRSFPEIDPCLLNMAFFRKVFDKDVVHINTHCDATQVDRLSLSIYLIALSEHAIGADNVVGNLDGMPTKVLRLSHLLDTLIVDRTERHAVTPLGSAFGDARRDVMLINVEADVQQ